jgi:hypothetical protein
LVEIWIKVKMNCKTWKFQFWLEHRRERRPRPLTECRFGWMFRIQRQIIGLCKKVPSDVVRPVEIEFEGWESILGYEVDDGGYETVYTAPTLTINPLV